MKRKILALLLACMMVISMVPASVFAVDDGNDTTGTEQTPPTALECVCEDGGKYTEDDLVVNQPPTCKDYGCAVYVCQECSDENVTRYVTKITANPDESAHLYTNACDADCNVCGKTRVPDEHEYKNACDADCDVCGAIRTPADHTYEENCDVCDVCGTERKPSAHKYDNACDADCNVCDEKREPAAHTYKKNCDVCDECGAKREPSAHVYDDACDADCNTCGATRVPADHEYDKDCNDEYCNVCGAPREPGQHKYDNACDADCNVCGVTRTPGQHQYDNACDADCNVCGDKREPAEHKVVTVTGKPATCQEDGWTFATKCSVCEKVFSASTLIPAGPDHHVWNAKKTWVAPTCTTEGYKVTHCSICNAEQEDSYEKTADALQHHYVAATCTAPKTCDNYFLGTGVCGATEGEALGHKPSEATCKATQNCAVCNEEFTLDAEKVKEHTPSEALCKATQKCKECKQEFTLDAEKVEEHKFANAATCIERQCTECGAKIAASAGHTDEELAAKAPTCTETGLTAGVICSVCKTITTAQKEVSKVEHEWAVKPATDPTYDEKGWTGSKECKVCGKAEQVGKDIPVLDEKIGFSYTVTGLNGISCVAVGGKVIVTVSMAVGENGARVEALQWAMNFDHTKLNFVGGTFGLKGMDYSMSNAKYADESGRVIITANVTSGAYKTFEEGEYAFATLEFEVKKGTSVEQKLAFSIDNYFLQFTRLDSFCNTLTVTCPEQPQTITVKNVLGNACADDYYTIDVNDLATLLRAMKPNASLYTEYWMCDVDQNGVINADDLVALRALIVSQAVRQ